MEKNERLALMCLKESELTFYWINIYIYISFLNRKEKIQTMKKDKTANTEAIIRALPKTCG